MAHQTLNEFMAAYDPDGTRVVADITPVRDADGNSPFVVIRNGRFSAVLALMPFDGDGAHLCIDVHPFVDGDDATAGVFGLSNGRRTSFPETGTTSHGWASANGVSVLIGEQAEVSAYDDEARVPGEGFGSDVRDWEAGEQAVSLAWVTSESADADNHDQEADLDAIGSPGSASWASVAPDGRAGHGPWEWVVYDRWIDVDAEPDPTLAGGAAATEDEAKAAVAAWVAQAR